VAAGPSNCPLCGHLTLDPAPRVLRPEPLQLGRAAAGRAANSIQLASAAAAVMMAALRVRIGQWAVIVYAAPE